jgi:hypothetical protein
VQLANGQSEAKFRLFDSWHRVAAAVPPPFTVGGIALPVHRGAYRYLRNPIYTGALLSLLGAAFFFVSTSLLLATALAGVLLHLWVILYEEPLLRTLYGEAYAGV